LGDDSVRVGRVVGVDLGSECQCDVEVSERGQLLTCLGQYCSLSFLHLRIQQESAMKSSDKQEAFAEAKGREVWKGKVPISPTSCQKTLHLPK
jgi:hypothetical protein